MKTLLVAMAAWVSITAFAEDPQPTWVDEVTATHA